MAETVLTQNQVRLKEAIREGLSLWAAEEYGEALRHFLAIRGFFDESEPAHLRHYFSNLGIVYRALGDYDSAVKQYGLALAIDANTDEELEDMAAVSANMGNALVYLDRPGEAIPHLEYAEDYFRRKYHFSHLGDVAETKARAYLALNEYELATNTARQAVNILLDCGDLQPASRAIRTLGMAVEAQIRER